MNEIVVGCCCFVPVKSTLIFGLSAAGTAVNDLECCHFNDCDMQIYFVVITNWYRFAVCKSFICSCIHAKIHLSKKATTFMGKNIYI